MDPRLRERRLAVAREQGRRRMRIVSIAVLAVSILGLLWLGLHSSIVAVHDVTVEGATRTGSGAVRKAAPVHDGDALLFVDTGAVARRVEALPWVAEAKVSRRLPNELHIAVVERTPAAWAIQPAPAGSPAGTPAHVAMLDASGRVLSLQALPFPGFPEIRGLARVPAIGSTAVPAAAVRVVAALPAALRSQTQALVVHGDTGTLLLQPVDGRPPAAGEVRLGTLEDGASKGAAALAVLQRLGTSRVAYVDVAVPSAPATGPAA
jgi:cell division protein FtsQ